MKKNSNIYILCAPVQSGKTTLLMNWIKTQQNVNGILTPDVDGKRKGFDIATNKYYDLESDSNTSSEDLISIGKFHFFKTAFDRSQHILTEAINKNPDWLIIDEVGKLEVQQQKGLEPAITNTINHYQQNNSNGKLLLVIRDSLINECIKHYGLKDATLITSDFFITQNKNDLIGLVVCGGQSTRMGTDKCFLTYHNKPQTYHLYELLQLHCKRVFISCNKTQSEKFKPEVELIIDDTTFESTGPMAALLSAFKKYSDQSFLIVGCDYPFITQKDLQELINARNKNAVAVCYINEQHMAEPLIAIYEKEIHPVLLNNFYNKQFSLRHVLDEVNAKKLIPYSYSVLQSIDTIQRFNEALKQIK